MLTESQTAASAVIFGNRMEAKKEKERKHMRIKKMARTVVIAVATMSILAMAAPAMAINQTLSTGMSKALAKATNSESIFRKPTKGGYGRTWVGHSESAYGMASRAVKEANGKK